ncbi:hypothetical protein E2562_014886 [Oryza meyeriana var. granulata]|uniref:Uncharacterized protein n=1 Tax=Oryza meyeriana var. granulata TaxID=110450 RepID=A0A6G1EIZ7_9ORYZ|nr:hypothetical protein E2562_014886 [Oryza meyeriana var. granulata]
MAIAILLGNVFCFVTLRIHMVVGIVPGLNMPTSVLSFYCLKWVVTLLRHCGIIALPFTRQEDIFLLTSVNICITIALTATYIGLGMAMQDLKTGYMTLTSSQAIVTGQIFGVIIGVIINPCIYFAFETTAEPNAPIGSRHSEYPCPYSGVYRAIGLMGMGGVKELPQYCILARVEEKWREIVRVGANSSHPARRERGFPA